MTDILVTEPLELNPPPLYGGELRRIGDKMGRIQNLSGRGPHASTHVSFTGPELSYMINQQGVYLEGAERELTADIEIEDTYMTAALTLPTQEVEGEYRYVNLVVAATPRVTDGFITIDVHDAQLGQTRVPAPFLPRLGRELGRRLRAHPDLQKASVRIENLEIRNGKMYIEFVGGG